MITLESFISATIGLLVSWLVTHFILGYSAAAGVGVSAMFFGLSFARGIAVRWAFARWAKPIREQSA